jgi:hypothetical protein
MTVHDVAIAGSWAVIDCPYSKKSVQCPAHIRLRLRCGVPFCGYSSLVAVVGVIGGGIQTPFSTDWSGQ